MDAALGYARRGIAVMPLHTPVNGGCSCSAEHCDNPGKHPRLRHGVHEASRDPVQVRRWWKRWPQANIGLRTGEVMDVCDVDGPLGLKALRDLLGDLPTGPVVRTGAGWHLWFQPSGFGNRVGMLAQVDWRGAGGSIIAPPSLHPTGRRYHWARYSRGYLPPCPAPLLELLRPPPPREPREIIDPGPYAERAVERAVRSILDAPVPKVVAGQYQPGGRNDALNRAAYSLGKLAAQGYLDERRIWTDLTTAARQAGLSDTEIRRTIASGLRAGLGV